jgi:hypothetical protein
MLHLCDGHGDDPVYIALPSRVAGNELEERWSIDEMSGYVKVIGRANSERLPACSMLAEVDARLTGYLSKPVSK